MFHCKLYAYFENLIKCKLAFQLTNEFVEMRLKLISVNNENV